LRKSEVEDSSSEKYVPPHRRHIKGKGNVICKNTNHNSAENFKKHSNKRSLPTCHHCGIIGHIRSICPHLQAQKSKVQKELPARATSTFYLRQHIRLHDINNSLFLLIKVANQRTNQGATRESRRSPLATMAMKGC